MLVLAKLKSREVKDEKKIWKKPKNLFSYYVYNKEKLVKKAFI